MPFFLATASPSFSALTTWCGLAGATGATNAVLPESINSGRSQRMISLQKLSRAVAVQWRSSCALSFSHTAVLWLVKVVRACLLVCY